MNTIKAFSEKEHAYHAYQARQNYLREQQSIQLEFDDLCAEVEQARADVEQPPRSRSGPPRTKPWPRTSG